MYSLSLGSNGTRYAWIHALYATTQSEIQGTGMSWVIFWVLCGVASAIIGGNKGLNGFAWFLFGCLVGPFGILLALMASKQTQAEGDAAGHAAWLVSQRVDPRDWMKTVDTYRPRTLRFWYGGGLGGYRTLEWRNGVLMYEESNSSMVERTARLEPTEADWQAFAARLEALGVYRWLESYVYPMFHGMQWSFAVAWPNGRQVRSSGSNAYPPAFDKFVQAVWRLAGIES
jgi:hypothetical protein